MFENVRRLKRHEVEEVFVSTYLKDLRAGYRAWQHYLSCLPDGRPAICVGTERFRGESATVVNLYHGGEGTMSTWWWAFIMGDDGNVRLMPEHARDADKVTLADLYAVRCAFEYAKEYGITDASIPDHTRCYAGDIT